MSSFYERFMTGARRRWRACGAPAGRGCGSSSTSITAVTYRHACKLGCEGIVSKRLGSPYVSGRTRHWLKFKNPAAPAVQREAEEDWGKERWR